MSDLLDRLAAPFSPAEVDWRVGSMTGDKKKGMALAYIDARTVQDRLNAVCGPLWQCDHVVSTDKRVTCKIGLRIGDEWIWRSDGAGETDVEGEKGSYSDSFKRAAVRWGIGRYLYDLASPWVEVEPMGKSYKIAAHEKAKLDALVRRVVLPTTQEPAKATAAPAAQPQDEVARLTTMGHEAADRGTDTLRSFWTGLKPEMKRAVGGEPQLKKWQAKAADMDKASEDELRGVSA